MHEPVRLQELDSLLLRKQCALGSPGLSCFLVCLPSPASSVSGTRKRFECVSCCVPVCVAAVLSMCLSEHFRDGKPAAYAVQVCQLTGLDRKAVQSQIRHHQEQLAPLIKLLPFSTGQPTAAGLEAVRNAGTLLKLRHLLHVANREGNEQHQPRQLLDMPNQQQEPAG